MSIKISDLNPIQFWLTGKQSFNQKVNAGVVNQCFAQRWQTGDIIITQFADDGTYTDYDLLALDINGNVLAVTAFTLPSAPYRQAIFTALMAFEGSVVSFRIANHADHTNLVAYSDPQLFEAVQPNTQLIQYSNDSNYSDLYFGGAVVFAIRVEAKIFQEQEVETNESEDLSDGTVDKLSSTNKPQKYLEVEPAPFYLHRKIKRALQCNTVFIDNEFWIKESDYTPELMDERYPFYTCKCWLTLSDGFLTNIIGDINADDVVAQSEGDAYDYSEHEPTYFEGTQQDTEQTTFIGGGNDEPNEPTYIGEPIDTEQGASYFGSTPPAHEETYLGDGTDDPIRNTFYRAPVNIDYGWGCIMDACRAYRNSLYWDDGDRVIWDDGDAVTLDHESKD